MTPQVPDVFLSLLQTIHDDLQEIKGKQSTMQDTLTAHIEKEPEEWAAVLEGITHKAFPNGDPEGHKRFHEDEMRFMEARAEFWKKMLFEVSKYGVLGVIGWLVYTAWAAFLHGPTK